MPVVNYDWDELEDNIVEEFDDEGNTLAEYTTEPDLFGNVISQNREGVESQFHFDALGSTLAVTDEAQQITDTRAYSAFGETTERMGTTEIRFQYVGRKEYQSHCGASEILVRRRTYHAKNARWISQDPIPFLESENLFVYSVNSPVVEYDPSGLRIAQAACETWIPVCKRVSSGLLAAMERRLNSCLQDIRDFGLPASGPSRGDTGRISLRRYQQCLEIAERCKPPNIVCSDCAAMSSGFDDILDGWERQSDSLGWFEPTSNRIVICFDKCKGRNSFLNTCRHEVVHAHDYCFGADLSTPSCGDVACSEVRAYSATTVCNRNRLRGESREECVRRLATSSVVSAGCPADVVTNSVLRRCYISTLTVPPWPPEGPTWPPWPF